MADRLRVLLPRTTLVTLDTDDHWVARSHAPEVAAAIARFASAAD